MVGTDIKKPAGFFIKAVEEDYEVPQSFVEQERAKKSRKLTEAEIAKAEKARKQEKEKTDAWFRAKERLQEMPEAERTNLWEGKRKEILSSEQYENADAGALKILELAIEGMIQAEIIEDFIKEEKQI